VYVSDYRGSDAFDAVFSLTTADTFLAGIAHTMLSGKAVPFEHRPIVQTQYLRPNGFWVMENGEAFDLSPYPELLNWARIMESVRKECLKQL
jgi:hypothetical protein